MIFILRQLRQELKDIIIRIPKDLKIWQKEYNRIGKKPRKSLKDIQIAREYRDSFQYYLGKWFAYLSVLTIIREYKC